VTLIAAPVLVPLLVGTRNSDSGRALVFGLCGLVLDFTLTFVTPALALSTDSAWQALKVGVRLLDQLWPRDVMYVIVPPLAITVVARLAPAAFGSAVVPAVAGAAGHLLTMLFAGATTFLYVREVDADAPTRLAGRTARAAMSAPAHASSPRVPSGAAPREYFEVDENGKIRWTTTSASTDE
jgi:hypothetical protein